METRWNSGNHRTVNDAGPLRALTAARPSMAPAAEKRSGAITTLDVLYISRWLKRRFQSSKLTHSVMRLFCRKVVRGIEHCVPAGRFPPRFKRRLSFDGFGHPLFIAGI